MPCFGTKFDGALAFIFAKARVCDGNNVWRMCVGSKLEHSHQHVVMEQILQALNKAIESRQWLPLWVLFGAAAVWLITQMGIILAESVVKRGMEAVKRWWERDRSWEPTPEEIRTIKSYLDWQVSRFPHICDFDFNPDKDYVENSKQLLSEQMDRDYGIKSSWWRAVPNVWKHTDIVKSITRPDKKRRGYAIIGEPASGKTVEMVKIFSVFASRWKKPGDCLPLMIFINSLPNSSIESIGKKEFTLRNCVGEYLEQLWEAENWTSHNEIFTKAFVVIVKEHWSQLRPVLLFDAVDECPDKKEYQTMVDAFAKASEALDPSAALVISCREGDYTAGERFARIRVLPLSQGQIIQHYKKRGVPHLRNVEKSLGDKVTMSHLSHYLTNVYFLTLYLEWAADATKGDLPDSIEKLFTAMFRRLLRKYKVVNEPTLPCLECFKDALAPVANLMTTLTMAGVMKAGTMGQPEVFISSGELLRAFASGKIGAGSVEPWRNDLWKFISGYKEVSETDASRHWHPDEVRLSKALNQAREQSASTALTEQLIKIAKDFKYSVPEKHEGEMRAVLISCFEGAGSDEQRLYMWMQMVIGIRATAWAIRSKLLSIDEAEGRLLRFRHQRIREFLSALWLDRNGIEKFLRDGHVDNAWWKQTTNMLAGVTRQPKLLLETLLTGGDVR